MAGGRPTKGPKKSLGQHWLKDRDILSKIAESANITERDTVLEIGPGLGTLTSELLRRAKEVVAVEIDKDLAGKLPNQFPGKNLTVVAEDILTFDLSKLPQGYKVVANVPYYITSKIVEYLLSSANKPSVIILLVQKEVAERLAAIPGDMSILAVSAQSFAEVEMGITVPAQYFTPPPKVDSAVVIMTMRTTNLLVDIDEKKFFKVVKAGFSAKRKKLRSSLSGGLNVSKDQAIDWLDQAGIDPSSRAEMLSIDDWLRLTKIVA
jgi:16S rRNA (adenine1518-N6/adenine1519-N6)-dimethyltransferase